MYTFNILCEVVVDISCCSALSVDIQKRLIRVNLYFQKFFKSLGYFVKFRPIGIWTMIHINRPWPKNWCQPVDLPTGAVADAEVPDRGRSRPFLWQCHDHDPWHKPCCEDALKDLACGWGVGAFENSLVLKNVLKSTGICASHLRTAPPVLSMSTLSCLLKVVA